MFLLLQIYGVLQRFVAMLAKPIRCRWIVGQQSVTGMTFLVKGSRSVWLGKMLVSLRHYHKDNIRMEI
jgi:hypothetical protein